jgi:hypothetical protein
LPAINAIAGVALTMTAADVSNFNQFTSTMNEIIIIENTAASPGTWTLTSVADPYGRTGDITTEAIAANSVRMFYVRHTGWIQAGSLVYLAGSATTIKFGVIRLS